ncbi:MAG: hypothetical protein FWF09_04605 [Bacteroidales bacterium]|nr:hypothetical protein [Bacteroidales bacterium]
MKHLFKKRTIFLLSIFMLFCSCIDKGYDFDKFNDDMVIKNWATGVPIGTIMHTAADLVERMDSDHGMVVEGDTIFFRYHAVLDFYASPGANNYGDQRISIFDDITPNGGRLYFSNPIFNCQVKNGSNDPITFGIKMSGTKDGYEDRPAVFSTGDTYSFPVPSNQTVVQRFDRENAQTHVVFRIGDPDVAIGPDLMVFGFSHDGPTNSGLSAEMTALLPMSFDAGSKAVFIDTMEMDVISYKEDYEDYEEYFEELVIKICYTNKMPAGGVAEVMFLDENEMPLPGLKNRIFILEKAELREVQMQGFRSKITQKETVGLMYVTFDKSEWEIAKGVKSMKMVSTMGNPDENIHFLPNDYLQFKVNFFGRGNINLDFSKF